MEIVDSKKIGKSKVDIEIHFLLVVLLSIREYRIQVILLVVVFSDEVMPLLFLKLQTEKAYTFLAIDYAKVGFIQKENTFHSLSTQ